MSCAPTSLQAALRSCGGCPARSPARNWTLADRVDTSRAAPNFVVQARLNSVPAQNSRGEYAHVRGIYFEAIGNFTLGMMNDAVDFYQLRSLWQDIRLVDVTGHEYYPSLDGRTIIDDAWFREYVTRVIPNGQQGQQGQGQPEPFAMASDNGLPANGGAGAATANLGLYFPFVAERPDGSKNRMEGLIPLALLQRRGADALTFRVGSAIRGNPAAPAGVTFDSLTTESGTPGMNIWLDIVYLPFIVADAPWTLDEYTLNELSGILNHEGAVTEYAWVRYFPEDANGNGGQALAGLIDGIEVQMAGFSLMPSLTAREALQRALLQVSSERDSSLSRSNFAQFLPGSLVDTQANVARALMLVAERGRQTAGAGPVYYRFNTQTAAFTRFVHRIVSCHTEGRAAAIAKAVACDPCTVFGTDSGGQYTSGVNSIEPAVIVPARQRSALRRNVARG